MKPVIFVGDMQQVSDPMLLVNELPKRFPEHELCYLGDFLDSWVSTSLSQVGSFKVMLNQVEDGIAKCVYSNHDCAYIFSSLNGWCSGWNTSTAAMVCAGPLALRARELLVPFVTYEPPSGRKVLVTHAGLSQTWLDEQESDVTPEVLEEWARNIHSPYYWVGRARGGSSRIGGPLWCDWDNEFKPVKGMVQVVGHTHQKHLKYLPKGQWCDAQAFNVDCLGEGKDNYVLELTSDGTFREQMV